MKPTTPSVLTVNGGSSSIKFALFEVDAAPQRILEGRIEGMGLHQGSFQAKGLPSANSFSQPVVVADHTVAVNVLMDWVKSRIETGALAAIGHRVVHGGPKYWKPQRITPEMVKASHGRRMDDRQDRLSYPGYTVRKEENYEKAKH